VPCVDKNGYRRVSIWEPPDRLHLGLHVLVCKAFNGPPPFSGALVRHLDGDPLNNVASNLAWGTHRENAADARAHGTIARGRRNGHCRLTEEDVRGIRRALRSGSTQAAVGRPYGVNQSTVSKIARGERWGWLE
jgi:hypothetical protein